MPNAASKQNSTVARWLLVCAALTFCIVIVGGITRLTRSGLSIVEWKPVAGVLPPLTEADWAAEFTKYRDTPEYQQVNRGMQLHEFKNIFWWEFSHRLLARLIGVVFLLPFLWFLIRKQIHGHMAGRLALIFCLGGAQGFLGWYMVKSGLIKDPHVSHLRLTSHLLLAALLYGTLLYTASQFLYPQITAQKSRGGFLIVIATFILLGSGALVAGLKAGKIYNTFPLMNGSYFPPGVEWQTPLIGNFFNNAALVQFIHRNLAYAVGVIIAVQLYRRRGEIRETGLRHPLLVLLAIYIVQVLLGALTLLNAVPVWLGAWHQANAMLLFTAALYEFYFSPEFIRGKNESREPEN
jgi:cytochrome c oxidase assembly protein subunit 15